MNSIQHPPAGVDMAPGQLDSDSSAPPMQSRRRYGVRGWLAIVTLIGVSFASYGGLLYIFDIYVKGEAGAFASTTVR
jgi:hypothetical protein